MISPEKWFGETLLFVIEPIKTIADAKLKNYLILVNPNTGGDYQLVEELKCYELC